MTDTFRKEYRELTEVDRLQMASIKDAAANLLTEMNNAVPGEERSEKSRCMNIARTNLEQAVMWAIKAVTA